jgi:hypothetical protein
MTINFENFLPEGTRQAMIQERITQLAAEGLANQLAKVEAEARNDAQDVAKYQENLVRIVCSIEANQAQIVNSNEASETSVEP